jgi:hypothetical protein
VTLARHGALLETLCPACRRTSKVSARKAFGRFLENQAHPSLHLERLRSDPRAWSVRVTLNYRAVALRRDDEWIWVWIGSHKDFDRAFPT